MKAAAAGPRGRTSCIARLDGGVTWSFGHHGSALQSGGRWSCRPDGYFEQGQSHLAAHGMGRAWSRPERRGPLRLCRPGTGSDDHGDIYYVRSTDNGVTWSAPIVLNDDPADQYQDAVDAVALRQLQPCLPSAGRKSNGLLVRPPQRDFGLQRTLPIRDATTTGTASSRLTTAQTWGANFPISDQIIPVPAQDDRWRSALLRRRLRLRTPHIDNNAYITWTDGRVAVGGVQVQNVEFATVPEP